MKEFLIALANIFLLASVLFMGLCGAVLVEDARSEELGSILTTNPAGGTCTPKGCSIVRK